jgi:hypothetical protein
VRPLPDKSVEVGQQLQTESIPVEPQTRFVITR